MLKNIKWVDILYESATYMESAYALKIGLENEIIQEIQGKIEDSLGRVGVSDPNTAKTAGIVAFWIRKLKPLSIHPTSEYAFLPLNEYAALKVGLAICAKYFDDAKKAKFALTPRILRDWIFSLRYNSHSPHSSMISFEMLACEK